MSATFFAFDVETTGLDSTKDEIIQFAYQVLDTQLNVLSSASLFVWPRTSAVSDEAARINGYSNVKWSANNAISQAELYSALKEVLAPHKRLTALGHNVKFDLAFLEALFNTHGDKKTFREALSFHSFDTVAMTMFFDYAVHGGLNGSYKLTHLTERFNIQHLAAHTADSDVSATVTLFKTLVELLRPEGAAKLASVAPPKQWSRFFGKNPDGTWLINMGKHKGKTLEGLRKSEPDYIQWMHNNLENLADEQREILQKYMA
jgi:DNA helicase-2/ATP-dependent DNA helicase PcrA